MTTPKTTLDDALLGSVRANLSASNKAFAERYPGDTPDRQPVHTVYGGAHIFKAATAGKLGKLAVRNLEAFAPDFATFARALDLPGADSLPTEPFAVKGLAEQLAAGEQSDATRAAWLPWAVYGRVREKCAREAVEDFRIDFEDGYGNRPDDEEDGHAVGAAQEVAEGMREGSLPPFIGIRIKPFTEELSARSIRTLDLFLSTLAGATGGKLPENFVVTLPKVTTQAQVTALADLFDLIEANTAIAAGALRAELMVETTQSIIDHEGKVALPGLVRAGRGRVKACHFGTYDYTASCNITAAYQKMDHPACDFATQTMQVALGQTGVWMSDGATVVMPVPPHRAPKGESLTPAQAAENTAVVHRAWKMAYDHNMHSLTRGIYQGWDLHPGQLPVRYAAVYTFFLESLAAASLRLKNFVEQAAQATLVGDVFDDAATGQGLLNYFLRALNVGAVTEDEVRDTGLTMEELRSRSFVKILDARRKAKS